jgi:hypothetical protein
VIRLRESKISAAFCEQKAAKKLYFMKEFSVARHLPTPTVNKKFLLLFSKRSACLFSLRPAS